MRKAGFRFPGTLHPRIVKEDDLPNRGIDFSLTSARQFFGVFAVFLLPPRKLLFPSIAYRTREKTVFGLCKTVIEERESEREWCLGARVWV